MARSVVVVAGAVWEPLAAVRLALPSYEIEVVRSSSVTTLAVGRWRGGGELIFVDRPSLGGSALDVVGELQQRLDASIVVLDEEDPEPSDIVSAILAGADLYVPRGLLPGLVLHWSSAVVPRRRPTEDIVRGYAVDAVESATRIAALHRTNALGDVVLRSVMEGHMLRRPLLRKARAVFAGNLLDDFAGGGIGDVRILDAVTAQQSDVAEPVAPPPPLFWNTRFPENQGILLNEPHLVVPMAEYLLETTLGPEPEPGAEARPQDSARLLGRQIGFRFEATNGEFQHPDSAGWSVKVVSPFVPCSECGIEPFRVYFRALDAGEAVIEAFLLVEGGSVDEQRIVLTAIDTVGVAREPQPEGRKVVVGRPAGRAVASAPSNPDYQLYLRPGFAELQQRGNLIAQAEPLPSGFQPKIDELARLFYAQLRDLSYSSPTAPDRERPLRLGESGATALDLARIGARLHHQLFVAPDLPTDEPFPTEEMRRIAELLAGVDAGARPLLQIHAIRFPVPWGLLYDRSSDGGTDLRTAADVDPNGFWGRRFDIYRAVRAVNLEVQRGTRCWVKPVIGAAVPRGDDQRTFLDELRSRADGSTLVVQDACSGAADLQAWVASGSESDFVYLFCHARSEDLAADGTTIPGSLGFGAGDTELRAELPSLREWWPSPRATHPIVFLNACSSGQENVVHGAPFVRFFLDDWEAQAFVGTDWPVNPSFADVFARRVLTEFLERGVSLRDALRTVSDEAASDGNFFPLIYAVYGPSSVQFANPAAVG